MSKILVVAEKPSVAADIVKALTSVIGKFDKHDDHYEHEKYIVTSAIGHLVEITVPEEFDVKRGKWSFAHLPVIPPYFDLRPADKTKSRLAAVVRLMKRPDVTTLVNACDAGREGELIFALIEQYAGGKKKTLGKPIKRLWLQSMTPQAIRDGFDNLRSAEQMRGLCDAARSRSEADWLVGINGTRAMTAFNSVDGGFFLTTVGRVQTPTLSLIVEREESITKHIAREYWEVHATFDAEGDFYVGRYTNLDFKKTDDPEQKAERLWSLDEALKVIKESVNTKPIVTDTKKRASQHSPLLFDLTGLQREANSKLGFSAKTTLSVAQALYEKHKVLTYPRTDSKALPDDYVSTAVKTMQGLISLGGSIGSAAHKAVHEQMVKPTKKVFDNSKISDHFAIIPTTQLPSGLSDIELKLYNMVVRRFIAVFFPAAVFQVTLRMSNTGKHVFKSEGKVLEEPGWLVVYGKEGIKELDGGKEDAGSLPKVDGKTVLTKDVKEHAFKTKPAARFNEATLLGAMENVSKKVEDKELRSAMQEKGLGTPATRASIIEGLLHEVYITREGKELKPTPKAFQLMTLLRGLGVEELTRAELTAEWEFGLTQMEKGELTREAFMKSIADMTNKMVSKAKEFNKETIPGDYITLNAKCPNCSGLMKENYRRYSCYGKDGTGCGFSIAKAIASRIFSVNEVETLLSERTLGVVDGFRSKAGWPFKSEVKIVYDEALKNHKLSLDFGQAPTEEGDNLVDFSGSQPLGKCPVCSKDVYAHGNRYVCSHAVATSENAAATCTFKVSKEILQQPIEEEQLKKLLETGRTDLLTDFVSNRNNRKFKAYLKFDKKSGKTTFEFEQIERPSKQKDKGGK